MRYGLEACKCLSPQEGVISTVERCHLEGYFFGPIILRRAEYQIECDFSRTSRLPTRNNSSKGRITLLNAAPVYFHFLKGFLINEVQSAATIHEYLGKTKDVHYWTEDQCGWCSGCSEFRFITGVKSDSRVTPWVYCCYLVDFGKATECPFSHII